MHFTAYIQVNAILWHCAFSELRALTNGSCVELNPMELNNLYDHMWELGIVLKGDNPLSVLDVGYRPWPKIKTHIPEVASMYDRLGTNLTDTRELLLSHQQATDSDQYEIVLKEVLCLFGEGIHESLRRTMGEFLQSTGGAKSNSKLKLWEKDK